MRLSRANIPLASEDRTHSQAISPSPHYNLAPHFWPGFINLQHFCHSRWRNPVRLSKSGSSAVGMYQMTDPAFAEARQYCIRHHTVAEDGCWFNGLYTRVVPSHAIELTAVFLDRNVAAILARRPNATANLEQKQELAAMIHLCGAASAKAFARRGFHLIAGERCGDHDLATYLAQVNAMKR